MTTELPDAAAIELIQKTAVDAAGARDKLRVVQLSDDDPRRFLVQPDGTFREIDAEPRPRTIRVRTITALSRAIADHFEVESAEDSPAPDVLVHYDYEEARANVDLQRHQSDGARDRFYFEARWGMSAEWTMFNKLDEQWSPRDLTEFITTVAADYADPAALQLVDAMKKLDWIGQKTEKVGAGGNYGQSTDAALTGAVEVPTAIGFGFDPYAVDDLSVRVDFVFYVRPDFERKAIRLIPHPANTQEAEEKMRAAVADRLDAIDNVIAVDASL